MRRETRSVRPILRAALAAATLLVAGGGGSSPAQQPMGHEKDYDLPPPLKDDPREEAGILYDSVQRESDLPWELPAELKARLKEKADRYRDYTYRFVCDEVVLQARYDAGGDASREKERRYGYFLTRADGEPPYLERRQKLADDGSVRGLVASSGPSKDDDRFPPPFEWLGIFSGRHEASFAFRYLGQRTEGFDIVHEIQFRGAVPYGDGRQPREWVGTMLVDAVTLTPYSLVAEPSAQQERIREVYRRYVQGLHVSIFGLVNFTTRPRPIGYRLELEFDELRDDLRFPTRVRYDTFMAVAEDRVVPLRASSRRYEDYRFTDVESEQVVDDSRP